MEVLWVLKKFRISSIKSSCVSDEFNNLLFLLFVLYLSDSFQRLILNKFIIIILPEIDGINALFLLSDMRVTTYKDNDKFCLCLG